MKRISIIACLVMCWCGVFAQSKIIRNASGLIIAMEHSSGHIKKVSVQPEVAVIDTMGTVDTVVNADIDMLNADEPVLLQVQDSLTFTDPLGEVIATFNPVTKEMRDMNGDLLFRIDENSQAIDSREIVIAWVDANGNLYGNDENKIAEGFGIAPYKLVYLFYYTNR